MRLISICIFFISGIPCFGQSILLDTITDPHWEVQVYFDVGIPIGQFGENLSNNGYGVGGEGLYHINGPIWVGIGVHSYRFDNAKITYEEQFDDDVIELRELTATRTVALHAIFRFQPELNSIFSPYVQGGLGWHWFFTNTKIKDLENDDIVDQFNELRDSQLGLALHIGVQISPAALQALNLDVRFGHFKNGTVQYMRYDSDLNSSPGGYPIESFETEISAVEFIGMQVGLMVRF